MHGGQVDVPGDLNQVVAIAGGDSHSMALKSDGTVVAWGDNSQGQASVPANLGRAVFIAAGGAHSLAVKEGGAIAAWGDNLYNQSVVGSVSSKASSVAAGTYHSLALLGHLPSAPLLINPARVGNVFSVSIQTIPGKVYFLEFKTSITDNTWQSAASAIVGDGTVRAITDSTLGSPYRFYRVRQQ